LFQQLAVQTADETSSVWHQQRMAGRIQSTDSPLHFLMITQQHGGRWGFPANFLPNFRTHFD
jgi:hypothetical protein